MRASWFALLATLLVCVPAAGEEPPSIEQVAKQVARAFKANDDAKLASLAAASDPDPWHVADDLCFSDEHDAALAFTKLVRGTDVEKLPAYVAGWRTLGPKKEERALLFTLWDVVATTPQKVVDQTGALADKPKSVIQIDLLEVRAEALRVLGKPAESEKVLMRAARAAQDLGWFKQAVVLFQRAGTSAYRRNAWAEALPSWQACRSLCVQREHMKRAARMLNAIGLLYHKLAKYEKALAACQQALTELRDLNDERGMTSAQGNLGLIHAARGAPTPALEAYTAVLASMRNQGNEAGVAQTLNNIGPIHRSQGRFQDAHDAHDEALKLWQKLKNAKQAAHTLSQRGDVHLARGDYAKALEVYQSAMTAMEKLEDWPGVARTLGHIGLVYLANGKPEKAIKTFEQARERKLAKNVNDIAGAATTLGNIADAYEALGDYDTAMATYEDAHKQMKDSGDQAGAARMAANIGAIHVWLGDYEEALEGLELAHAAMKRIENHPEAARTLGIIGVALSKMGRHDEAIAKYQQALKEIRALGHVSVEADMLNNIGVALDAQGKYAEARDRYLEAIALFEKLEDNKAGEAMAFGNLGEAYQHLGDVKTAKKHLRKSVRLARDARATLEHVSALTMLARLSYEQEDMGDALRRSRTALDLVGRLLGGLCDEHGAEARGEHAGVYAIGALAATKEDDTAEAFAFMESGRAGEFLDSLDRREAIRWKAKTMPADLKRADEDARAALRDAQSAYDDAAKSGDAARRDEASRTIDAALEALEEVASRIQRTQKRQASMFYFEAKSIDAVQEKLGPNQALVLYGLYQDQKGPPEKHLDRAIALVVRQDDARLVDLGKASEILTACATLIDGVLAADAGKRGIFNEAEENADQEDKEAWPKGVQAARRHLIEPLKLGADVKQVLVSPHGVLGYLPYGALFARPVALTPSGATHLVLLEDANKKGTGVLAIGDPNYEGASLSARKMYYGGAHLKPLPNSRAEVEQVGTTKLLGKDASEGALYATLPKSDRWRAVHFACHGWVNVAQPTRSSLALAPTEDHDGFVTPLEIRDTPIPTDLAVLSACSTSRGKHNKSEGIVNLARSFMFAGAPRVICSLWDVDDAATAALMIEFYKHWNGTADTPGVSAAEALQRAQAHIRAQKDKQWDKPFYWAAWVLWGLPD